MTSEKHPDQEITVTTSHPNEVALFQTKGFTVFRQTKNYYFLKGSVLFNGKNCFSCASCKMVPLIQIHANHYNPNKVAEPELELLELSIREDGFTQPLVCYFDNEKKGTY